MRCYSIDLRKRVVQAVKEEKQSVKQAAERFGISRWTVNRYLKRNEDGHLEARKASGRPQALNQQALEQLKKQVKEHPDWTREEHALALSEGNYGNVKRSSIGNYFKRLKLSFKKEESLST